MALNKFKSLLCCSIPWITVFSSVWGPPVCLPLCDAPAGKLKALLLETFYLFPGKGSIKLAGSILYNKDLFKGPREEFTSFFFLQRRPKFRNFIALPLLWWSFSRRQQPARLQDSCVTILKHLKPAQPQGLLTSSQIRSDICISKEKQILGLTRNIKKKYKDKKDKKKNSKDQIDNCYALKIKSIDGSVLDNSTLLWW